MNVDLRYLGHSGLRETTRGAALSFSPNLARPPVFFDGALAHPLRFREAMSALHDVVVGDLRKPRKDRSAWQAWKQQEEAREAQLRVDLLDRATRAELSRIAGEPVPPDFEARFRELHGVYWRARTSWASTLAAHDPALFRHLIPCDPVVTVAPDVVFFECFSKDESSYGCLSVDRSAFEGAQEAGLGTTNVDYSLALYEHFQTLRSYRETRLLVDPTGFEVNVAGRADYREEKIDLPPSWLRGFGQIQAAMSLPSRRVDVPVEAVYSILAHLARHREKTGPRSLRFQLVPGQPPVIFIDPWGIPVVCRGSVCEDDGALSPSLPTGTQGPYRAHYAGAPAPTRIFPPPFSLSSPSLLSSLFSSPPSAPTPPGVATIGSVGGAAPSLKIWGRRRLGVLARVLPLAERVEVRLLGDGMPSLWIVHMGEMRFTLALSGWTASDWTGGTNLDVLGGMLLDDVRLTDRVVRHLEHVRRASFGELAAALDASSMALQASLHRLAKQGQVIYDHAAECYRYRQVMPVVLSEAILGPEPPEIAQGKELARASVELLRDEPLPAARRLLVARVRGTRCEAVLDLDGTLKKGRCTCSYFHRNRLKAGPCRHLLAVRLRATGAPLPPVQPQRPARTAQEPALTKVAFYPPALEAMTKAAKGSGKTLAALLEQTWDDAFERLQSAPTWEEARRRAGGPAPALPHQLVRGVVARPLRLHPDVVTEIQRVAEQLEASPAAVISAAWLIALRNGDRKR
ncbi:SWIM zinc finger family protein [Chondromyces apiculatus]|uniref:SWIM-type domain-containing protein n=1 Tax=Chondromyces apiculatus DSM 436 TaxID=1192034 RepID=A0A017TCR9_9BACT|nr:SWIM zinc finger family protein [Chondromyces apiculatus]EYF06431.1 Hypothetical protein CAP_1961 [Chondromyces apiculatus DSM 436]